MSRFVPLICALIFALLHVLTVVVTLFATHGSGEGQALTVALLDFPLVLLLQAVPRGTYILYGSTEAYVWFFSIAGTVMYAAVGYCVGILIRAVTAIAKQKVGRATRAEAKAAGILAMKMSASFVVVDVAVFLALGGLTAITSLPVRPLQDAWISLHLPAFAIANAVLSLFGAVQEPIPLSTAIAFGAICLIQPAAIGALIGWLAGTVRAARARSADPHRAS
jgi:hypothetical protein